MSGTLLVTEPAVADLAEATFWSWIQRADRAVNRFLPDSEVSRLNLHGTVDDVSDDFLMFLEAATDVARVTDGLCDPTVLPALLAWGYDRDFDALTGMTPDVSRSDLPCRGIDSVTVAGRTITSESALDFGASAKALVADKVAEELASHCDVLVEIGGDVAVRCATKDSPWTIGVATDDATETAPRIDVMNGGVATSSTTFRRWSTSRGDAHHIIDPRTGRPASSQWAAITVAAPSCLYANALATAGFLWNDDAPWHIGQTGWAARLVDRDGVVVTVGSWPKGDE